MSSSEQSVDLAQEENKLAVYLVEYKSLRDEILARLQTQRQAFNYTVIVLGAAVSGVAILASKEGMSHYLQLLPQLSLLLPLIIGPLAFIFFDDELVMYRDIFHICQHLRLKVFPLISENVFLVEADGFARLKFSSRSIHGAPLLSKFRTPDLA